MRELSVETLEALAGRAVQHGIYPQTWGMGFSGVPDKHAGRIRRYLEWDVSGSCQSPRPVELFARYSVKGDGSTLVDGRKAKPMTVVLHTRCRRCGWCKNQRRKLWSAKAITEFGQAPRTWFLTLTLRPEEQYRLLCAAREAIADYDRLPHDKRFAGLVRAAGPELTRFIKRVRTNSGVPLRYLLVAEAHQTGLPHFHMLLHEKVAPCRKAVIKDAWRLGWSKVTLAGDARGAMYLCKYLAKDSATRVRASFAYGRQTTNTLVEHSVNEVAWEDVIPQDAFTQGVEGDYDPPRGVRKHSPHTGIYGWTEQNNGAVSETSLSDIGASGSYALYETSPPQPGVLVAEDEFSEPDF